MILLSIDLCVYFLPSVSSDRRVLLVAVLIVHGNHLPIILFQSTFSSRYSIIPIDTMVRNIPIRIFSKLIVVLLVNCKRMRSKNGLPRNTLTNIMISLYKNSPANIAVANFHGLYFARPSVMYIILPEIGVVAAINAPIHPYLLTSFSREDYPPLCFLCNDIAT